MSDRRCRRGKHRASRRHHRRRRRRCKRRPGGRGGTRGRRRRRRERRDERRCKRRPGGRGGTRGRRRRRGERRANGRRRRRRERRANGRRRRRRQADGDRRSRDGDDGRGRDGGRSRDRTRLVGRLRRVQRGERGDLVRHRNAVRTRLGELGPPRRAARDPRLSRDGRSRHGLRDGFALRRQRVRPARGRRRGRRRGSAGALDARRGPRLLLGDREGLVRRGRRAARHRHDEPHAEEKRRHEMDRDGDKIRGAQTPAHPRFLAPVRLPHHWPIRAVCRPRFAADG